MKNSRRMGLASCLLLSALSVAASDEKVPFSRIYHTGEKSVYSAEMVLKQVEPTPTSVDMTVTTVKALDTGKARLRFHWSNLHHGSNDTSTLPADVTLTTAAHNMPGSFQPTIQTMDFLAAVLQLASATADRRVAVGEETPIIWPGAEMGFKGKVKLLDVNASKNRFRALVSSKLVMKGKEVMDITFTSVYDLTTRRMLSSEGAMSMGMELKFKLKQ